MEAEALTERKRLLSVTLKDCTVQVFRAGGPGGQNQNKVNSGVRVIHPPSGARGESREHRDQPANKKAAFLRMAATPEFQRWCRVEAARLMGLKSPEEVVEAWLTPENLKVETRETGTWQSVI